MLMLPLYCSSLYHFKLTIICLTVIVRACSVSERASVCSGWIACGCLQPKAVTSADEVELAEQLENLRKLGEEVGGDSSEDSYSDGGGSGGGSDAEQ